MYNEKITNDILFEIDMQLYDEFNNKLCEMNEHLGDIYSLRDVEEIEQAEKEKERKLLREAINKLQKENEELETKINKVLSMIDDNYRSEWYDDYETIAGLRDDIYDLLKIKYKGVKD